MVNLAFYISRKATRFKKLLDSDNKELINSIKVVFSDDKETMYLKDKLKEFNISYILYDYSEIDSEKKYKNLKLSDKLLGTLIKFEIDYCFSFGSHILEGELLHIYENRIINFHPSIYPHLWAAIDQAIEANANY